MICLCYVFIEKNRYLLCTVKIVIVFNFDLFLKPLFLTLTLNLLNSRCVYNNIKKIREGKSPLSFSTTTHVVILIVFEILTFKLMLWWAETCAEGKMDTENVVSHLTKWWTLVCKIVILTLSILMKCAISFYSQVWWLITILFKQ